MNILFTLFAIFLTLFCSAQNGNVYGGTGADFGYQTEATPDGGFAIAGQTSSIGSGNNDYWLVKFDSLGNKEWDFPYGTSSYDNFFSFHLASNGSYLLAGYTGSIGANREGALIYKIDTGGTVIWTKTLQHNFIDHAHSLIENYEGGYYVAGHLQLSGSQGAMWAVKLDSAQNILWDSAYSPAGVTEHVHAAALTPDSGLILLGHSYDNSFLCYRLVKVDKNGHLQWSQKYSTNSNFGDTPYQIRITAEGNYAMFGSTETGPGVSTFWLKVVDTAGTSVLDKHYGTNYSYCYGGRQTSDKGFMLIGTKSPGVFGNSDMLVIKTDSAGNAEWTNQYGGTAADLGYDFTPLNNGHCVFTGESSSFGTGTGRDMWVLLSDSSCSQAAVPNSIPPNTGTGDFELKIFPNPAHDFITVQTGEENIECTIRLTGILGNEIVVQKTLSTTHSLSFPSLPPGLYFIRLTNSLGYERTGKVIVK